MKKFLKWTLVSISVVMALLLIAIFSLQGKTFDAPYPDNIVAVKDSTVIARGQYLVYGPAHCGNCHSPMANQARINAGEILPLSGGFEMRLPIGTFYGPNLTPDKATGIGHYSDADLARAMRHGVAKDGRALFDFMPFQHLSNEDMIAIVSYLRSQPAVSHAVPKADLNLIGKAVKAFLIKPVSVTAPIPHKVQPDTTASYGNYLANNVANCRGCHTERNLQTGAFVGEPYAGGTKFMSAREIGSYCVTPNLTPHQGTGAIYGWSQEDFIARFKKGRVIGISEMPWELFSRMTENDLKAIYQYLQTLKPVQKEIGPTYVAAKG